MTSASISNRPRAELLRWASWFFIANAGVMAIIGLRYLLSYPLPDNALVWFYDVVAYVGQFALLGFAPMLVIALLIVVLPRPRIIKPLAVVLAAAMLALLLLDTLVFAKNHFHLNTLTVAILGWQSWLFAGIYFVIFLIGESFLARMVGNWIASKRKRGGPWLATGLVACVLMTQVLHIWADARYYVPITSFSPYLPLFKPMTAKSFLTRHDIIDVAAGRDRGAVATIGQQDKQRLDYPKQPMSCSVDGQPKNVMLILVDAMRGDSLRPDWAPSMSRFADSASVFEQHFSGGNSSRIGTFSLFYGLPATYWSDFKSFQRAPVLMNQFQANDYQFGLFTSKPLYRATSMDRTVFAGIPELPKTPTNSKDTERDQVITDRWINWLDRRNTNQPFFGFLFYDSLNYQDFPSDYPRLNPPAEGESKAARDRANYPTSLHYVDSLVGRVLDDLQQRELLDDTIVIISADHGQEFNENGLGYVGYGSNYSDYQLHVPLVVHWPGREPVTVERRTAHRDIPVTLLSRLLGCSNPPSDYSTGSDLFDGEPWQWLVTGSYSDHAVVEPERVTVVQPGGYFEIRGADYHLIKDARIHQDVINEALAAMSRFYR